MHDMKTLIIAALCAMGSAALADYSLLDNVKFVRAGEFADKVVWGKNADGTKNVTIIQDGAQEVEIAADIDVSK